MTTPLKPVDAARDQEQRIALRAWAKNGYRGSVIAGTGFGKSRVGIMAIGEMLRLHEGRGLVLVPTTQLQDQFATQFHAWGYSDVLDRVDILCYQTAYKLFDQTWTVTVADEVHLGLSPMYRAIFEKNTHERLLCMTATLPEEDEYRTLLVNIAQPVYTITLDQCVARGFVAPYRLSCIAVQLTDEELAKYKKANNLFVYYKLQLGQFDAFNEANRILGSSSATPEQKKNATLFYSAIRQRKEIVQHAQSKIEVTKQLLLKFPEKKALTFAGTNNFTDLINKTLQESDIDSDRYHSLMKAKERREALERFKQGSTRVLCSTKALNQGFDVPDAQLGIICGLDSKALQMIQRVGRLVRFAPNKIGEIIVLYVADSQEEVWLKNAVRNLSNVEWIDHVDSYI